MKNLFQILFIIACFFISDLSAQSRSKRNNQEKRNIDQFKINAYPIVTEDENVKLLVYGLIPYQSLQFLKSNMSFVAGYETSISIRDKDGNQLDRKTFQSNVKVGDYISTVDRSSREVVMAEFLVKDQEYTIVGELIDQDTRIKGFQKKYSFDILPKDTKIRAEILYNKYDVFRNLFSWYMYAGVLLTIVVFTRHLLLVNIQEFGVLKRMKFQ